MISQKEFILNTPASASVFNGESFKGLFYNGLVNSGIAPNLASFTWALFYTLVCYSIIWMLYRRKIFIKI